MVVHTTQTALLAEVEFSPVPGARSTKDDAGWTTGVNDLLGRMSGSDDPDSFTGVELRLVLSSLLQAGGVHQDQRKVVLDGCNGKAGLLKLIKDLVKK